MWSILAAPMAFSYQETDISVSMSATLIDKQAKLFQARTIAKKTTYPAAAWPETKRNLTTIITRIMAQYQLPKLLSQRVLMLGRALPRFHNDLSTPTQISSPLEKVTASQTVGVRVPVMAYDDYFKRVGFANDVHHHKASISNIVPALFFLVF